MFGWDGVAGSVGHGSFLEGRFDDHASALNIGIHRCVRVSGKPVGKAGQIDIVDEIGIERRFGKLRGGAGCIRRKMGQDDGVGRAAKPAYPCLLLVILADIVLGRDAPLVLTVGQVIKIEAELHDTVDFPEVQKMREELTALGNQRE